MDPFSAGCSRLRRFVSEHFSITSVTVLVTFPIMASLAALVVFSDLACSSPASTTPTPRLTPLPPHERKPTPTPSPQATPLTLFPPVMLEEPKDGSYLACGSAVALRWSWPNTLEADEYYRLKVQGQNSSILYLTEPQFTLPDFSPGDYKWDVAVVRFTAQDQYVPVSEQSNWYSFKIALPAPVVHSISPTCTAQGTSVTVVVSGENFTRSLALAIGIPFPATFVNSSTITTTIPTTLEAGKYPVIVKDSLGQGDSFASFTVSESTPVLSEPALPPWSPATPVPTAPPGYNPIEECVVPVCAPAPMLIEPLGGTQFAYGGGPELKWSWTYCLPDGWKFAVRVSLVVPPSSISYVDSPNLVSCHNGKTIARFPLGDLIKEPGIYYWNIAVVRSVGFGWERLSYESEVRSFEVLEPRDDEGSP